MKRLLTEKELKDLPEGCLVAVTWSGGNGPHFYTVHHWKGSVYAVTERDNLANPNQWMHRELETIGEKPKTQVWLLESEVREE